MSSHRPALFLARECKRQGFQVRRTKAGYQVRDPDNGRIVNFHASLSQFDKNTAPALRAIGVKVPTKLGGAMPSAKPAAKRKGGRTPGTKFEQRFPCRVEGCDRKFSYEKTRERHEVADHGDRVLVKAALEAHEKEAQEREERETQRRTEKAERVASAVATNGAEPHPELLKLSGEALVNKVLELSAKNQELEDKLGRVADLLGKAVDIV